jgi:uncharacterized protein (TIGR02145 family)
MSLHLPDGPNLDLRFMTSAHDRNMPIRVCVVSLALSLAFGSATASLERPSAQDPKASGTTHSSKRMADGKQWTTANLNVDTVPSYCYDDAALSCREYGRLYTWESAQRGCQSLGDGWRLPTNDEWRQMAKHYGGLLEDSKDTEATYKALLMGGSSGFNALLGGSRTSDGQYDRLAAHGLYWTASESGPATAWLYNFGRGGQALNRHSGVQKQMGASVRCVRE